MTESASDRSPEAGDSLEEIRLAAGEVIASLKRLLVATEHVVADPAAFQAVVESGKSVVDSFASGFGPGPDPA